MTSTELRALVHAHGGLVSQSDMARNWDLGRSRVNAIVKAGTFPEPVGRVGSSDVWARDEVDAWRMAQLRSWESTREAT